MTLSSGARLGPYEILAPLGAGGMGEVYKARDTRLDRSVAVKVLPEEFFEDKDRVARFEREAKSLATLNHPGIAAVSFVLMPDAWFGYLRLLTGAPAPVPATKYVRPVPSSRARSPKMRRSPRSARGITP